MQERRECEVEILFFNFTRTRTSISSHSSATSCQICFFFECRQCRREGNVGRMFALQHHPSKRPPYRPLQLIIRGGIGWEKGMKKKDEKGTVVMVFVVVGSLFSQPRPRLIQEEKGREEKRREFLSFELQFSPPLCFSDKTTAPQDGPSYLHFPFTIDCYVFVNYQQED